MWPFGNNKPEPQKKVEQTFSGGPIIGMFVATQNFSCTDTGSEYVKGMTYNIREGNHAIQPRIDKWVAEGKVRYC